MSQPLGAGTASGSERRRVAAALLALSDRAESEILADSLLQAGAAVYATAGTAAHLRRLGLDIRDAQELTRSPELLGGRVKTLSADLFAGILARRADPAHRRELEARGLPEIDLVAVTLYPFERLPAGASWSETVERIDVGGVALLRAAAKNFESVVALSEPSQYGGFRDALERGGTTLEERRSLAEAAFARTAAYDAHIQRTFRERGGGGPPEVWLEPFRLSRSLRYGENPHQEAFLYQEPGREPWWSEGALHEGKELSYNNLLDLEAAIRLAGEFVPPACGIVKHNEPSSVGLGEHLLAACERALAGDALSAYGGVVAVNRELDPETAEVLARQFVECIAAPRVSQGARRILVERKRLRVVQASAADLGARLWQARPIAGGLLLQRLLPDAGEIELGVVTRRAPTPAEMEALHFAWTVVGLARSNAVVVSRADRSLGIGSGQTSRIDALRVALLKARRAEHDTRGAVLASDGFFPFDDWVPVALEAGLTACIQPGGSIRDAESIGACDAAGLAMVFTGRRAFRH
jgi:phosphoribosylaminoimidazolecarboxamide formyltransferase/IMP cyclohydrolase